MADEISGYNEEASAVLDDHHRAREDTRGWPLCSICGFGIGFHNDHLVVADTDRVEAWLKDHPKNGE